MSTTQTVDILKECDSGVKMALAALDDVWEHIREPELRAILNTTRAQHQLVGREVQALLQVLRELQRVRELLRVYMPTR